jgi:hypothetical protein
LLTGLAAIGAGGARAGDIPAQYRPAVRKGLEWLVKQQHKDGHWSANGGQYRVPMTALAGTALLMEGSTTGRGRYAGNLRRAVAWLLRHSRKDPSHLGLISDLSDPGEAGHYIFGHGYAILFLSAVYEDEEDRDRRHALKGVLNRAVQFTAAAQTGRGGWGYVARAEGGEFDEGAATMTQIQALRAAGKAGIPLPRGVFARGRKYLHQSTTARGGIVYSLASGGSERPALTAAAIPCAYGPGEYDNAFTKKWLRYCQQAIPLGRVARIGHDEFTHYYYAQAAYALGDDGYARLFPRSAAAEGLTWSKYRRAMFDSFLSSQHADGSWRTAGSGSVGPVYTAAVYLTILQLDRNVLPLYQK